MSEIIKAEEANIDMVFKLARKSIAHFGHKKFENIRVDISMRCMSEDTNFNITVFDKHRNNRGFYFYSFTKATENESRFNKMIEIIESDDFEKISNYASQD